MTDPVLLLHGQPGSARDWTRLEQALRGSARTIALDRPGWDRRSQPTGLAGNAEAAVAALDAAGVERAVVVGHSFGGGVAAWLAANHPERVSRLILAAPAANCASLTAVDRSLALPVLGAVASTAMLIGSGAALETPPLRRSIAGRLGIEARYLRGLSGMLLAPGSWRAFAVEQRALVRELPTLEQSLGRITAPTLVVMGAADRVVPAEAARRLADQIPHAELVLLPRAGHLLPHLEAERLAAIMVGSDLASATRPHGVLGG